MSTVWRTVATGDGGSGRKVDVADVANRCQAVEVARKMSTVWRTVATGERWLRANGGYGRTVATFASYPWGVQRLFVVGLVRFDDFKLMGLHR